MLPRRSATARAQLLQQLLRFGIRRQHTHPLLRGDQRRCPITRLQVRLHDAEAQARVLRRHGERLLPLRDTFGRPASEAQHEAERSPRVDELRILFDKD